MGIRWGSTAVLSDDLTQGLQQMLQISRGGGDMGTGPQAIRIPETAKPDPLLAKASHHMIRLDRGAVRAVKLETHQTCRGRHL
jgi:hypothetical protein